MLKPHLTDFIYIFLLPLFLWTSCTSTPSDHDDDHQDMEDHHHHEEGFEMDHHQIEKFDIRIDTLTPGQFSEVIKTSGIIESSPADIITITARKTGVFSLSPGVNIGATLTNGSPIGFISPDGVEGGDLSKAAIANLEIAKREYDRLKPLFDQGLITASALNEAEKSYKEAEALASPKVGAGNLRVTSPANGTLSSLLVNSGQFVEAGTPIATLTKNTRLSLRADIPSRLAASLPSLTSANFRPENSDSIFSLASLDGKKISDNSSMIASAGYLPIFFTFSGNPSSIPVGFAEVFLLGAPRENIISVPTSSLIEMQGNYYLYAVHHGHVFEKRLVKTGATDGIRVEILEGLNPGEQFVSKGASIVRMAETSAIAPPAHSHNH